MHDSSKFHSSSLHFALLKCIIYVEFPTWYCNFMLSKFCVVKNSYRLPFKMKSLHFALHIDILGYFYMWGFFFFFSFFFLSFIEWMLLLQFVLHLFDIFEVDMNSLHTKVSWVLYFHNLWNKKIKINLFLKIKN